MVGALLVGCASSDNGFEIWTDPALGRAVVAPAAGGSIAAVDRSRDEVVLPADADADAYARLALARNPGIEAAEQRVGAAQARVTQARGLGDPELMVTPVGEMGETLDGMTTLMAGVTQELPFPGKLSARAAAAEAGVAVAQSELRATRLRVVREVRQAYWRYYNAARSLEVTREGVELLRHGRDAAEAGYRAGGGAQGEVLAANMEVSERENELLTLEARRRAAEGALNALLDRPLTATLPTPAARGPDESQEQLDALLARASRHNPELVTMRERLGVGRRNLRLARLERLPNFSVGLQYNVVDPEEAMNPMLPTPSGDDEWWLTFGVTLPIWGGKYDAMEAGARRELLAGLADLRSESNRVASEVQAAAVEAETQLRIVRLFRDTLIPQSRQAHESASSAYRAGRGDFAAVVESTGRVLEYQQMYHQAHAELGQMLAELAELAGDEPVAPEEVQP